MDGDMIGTRYSVVVVCSGYRAPEVRRMERPWETAFAFLVINLEMRRYHNMSWSLMYVSRRPVSEQV